MKFIMKRLLAACLIFVFCASASAGEYQEVLPGHKLTFPGDFFYRKDYRVQWWYFTGHLFDEQGREFGYELTFFVVGVQKREYRSKFGVDNIYISHFAVSDLKEKRFLFSDKADSGAFDFAGAQGNGLAVWVGSDRMEGTTNKMHIIASDGEKTIDLVLVPAKPVVLHGDNGYSRKSEESPLAASYYFSYTNLKTEGRLKIGEREFRVHGKSWFDREISTRGLGKGEIGWDWFSIQLDDDREIMFYMIRKNDGSSSGYSSGTVVYRGGAYRHLSAADFKITVLEHFKSERSGARYPSRWEVVVPSESLTLKIAPLIRDQEFSGTASTGNYYWEGACSVEGSAKGRAYVEMTGY
jgi:predicted secreted hydrolase